MVEKTFLSDSNTAQFICIACNRQFIVDMTEYLNIPSIVKIKVKCKCGHSWTTAIEKRRHFRKNVHLTGTYKYREHGKEDAYGSMTVLNISRKGLKIKLHDDEHHFKDGDWLEVTFRLDNQTRTLLKRMVHVKNVFGNCLGVAFSDTKHEDADIGFYLLQHLCTEQVKS
jgi:hypothetical protein